MTANLAGPKLVAAIGAGLDRAFKAAAASTEDYDPATDRVVVFSDHHRGTANKADDFRTNVHAYASAMGYYLEQGYRLFLLGDSEELWEERPQDVLEEYRDVLALEAEFRRRGANRLERFWGNHDDLWKEPDAVARLLNKAVGGPIRVREGLRMRVARAGAADATLFFVHGHQGTTESDRYGKLARLPVRYLWRPFQRLTGFSATTPASRFDLSAPHDEAMYRWARDRGPGLVLIAGHTHRPVFAGSKPDPAPTRPVAVLQAELVAARAAADKPAAGAVRAELEYALAADRRKVASVTVTPPCYFNTGCCSYPDGDVTGLELADGQVRLVRWPANLRELRTDPKAGVDVDQRILKSAELEEILEAVANPGAPASFEIHAVGAPAGGP